MARRDIAIVGSLGGAASYDPPLTRLDEGPAACEALGRELARCGCDIFVYSSAAGFIEGPVVRGYVASKKAKPGSIHVRLPVGKEVTFPEYKGAEKAQRDLFDIKADSSPDWEVSFYRSIANTHGVLLLGGGRSTFITGIIALAQASPVLTLTMFGGSARKVWESLDRENGLATEDEVALMAQEDWDPDTAARLVRGLVAADERRAARQVEAERATAAFRRRSILGTFLAAILMLAAGVLIAVSEGWEPGSAGPLLALFVGSALGGAAGSIVRLVTDRDKDWPQVIGLGVVAGIVTCLLFLVAQVATTPDVFEKAGSRLLTFNVVTSFIAGLTFDVVFDKLRHVEIVNTAAVERTERKDSP